MRRLLPSILLLLATVLAACGAEKPDYSTPQKTLEALVRADVADDRDAYADCFVTAEQAGMRETKGSNEIITRAGEVKQHEGFTVGMLLYFTDGKKTSEQPIVFVQENGDWKASWAETEKYRAKHWQPVTE